MAFRPPTVGDILTNDTDETSQYKILQVTQTGYGWQIAVQAVS